jgi:hypothetical protein
MDVAQLLSRISLLSDLRLVPHELGHEVTWQELPIESLPVPVLGAARAGRAGSLEWIAVHARPARATAGRLSRALALRGRLAGVLALDEAARELAVAITVDRTAVAGLSLDHPEAGERERLRRLLGMPQSTGLGFALRATEILESEDLGRRFFLAFRDALDQMAQAFPEAIRAPDRRALALIQLTRVLFLYFVQAKGWLDGRADFLQSAVDDVLGRRRSLHRDLFRPLFFGTLNRRPEERRRARRFGRIPFLNGGLFEPHSLEQRWRADVPNPVWREAFDRVFERFHFTIEEGGDASRIAPDMLGRVFEGLMAPGDRRSSGAFYTPAALVRKVVGAAIDAWVSERLGVDHATARARLSTPDAQIQGLLGDITILDPAVGSGAFLLGALERLACLRAPVAPPAELRRRILERNLFGVDLNPMAVRLAELRLWLALIAAEPAQAPEQVAPLPNLNGTVRQGDSLLDPAWALARLGARPAQTGTELRALRRAFVAATGAEKRELLRRLRRAEVRALGECLDHAETAFEQQTAECLSAARSTSLFGERRGLDRQLAQRLRALRQTTRELRRIRRHLRREGEVPWFTFEAHFGDILAQGGFDVIVGNPPWVRAEHLPASMREALARRFRWWRGSGRGFRHQPDLAVAFLERSAELLAPQGLLALLLPAKVATAGYARTVRGALADRFTLHMVADLTQDPAALFQATTYPALVMAARSVPVPGHEVRLALDGGGSGCAQSRFAGGGPWLLLAAPEIDAVEQARGAHPRLGQRFTPQLGVKTGANAVYLDPPPEVEPALVKRAVRGRDVRPFRAEPRVRLLFPHTADGVPHPRLPPGAARHLARHEALLLARVDYRGGPPWTLFRVRSALEPYRLIWADLARRLTAAPLLPPQGSGVIPLNSCYILPMPGRETSLALAAWLNSTWIRAVARAGADQAAGGFARFNARVVAALPLPDTVLDDRRLIELAERGTGGAEVQQELDNVCAEHLAIPAPTRALLARLA